MPTYSFENKDTKEEFDLFMSISSLEDYLKSNPNIVQRVNGAPMIHSGRGMKKPDSGFRDLLKTIKKGNSGFTSSTVNTF